MYQNYFNADKSIDEILQLNNGEMGLMGPGNGYITRLFEKIFGWIDVLNSHSVLQDAFGRFNTHHSLGRVYVYVLPEKYSTKWMKGSPVCGQFTGIIYCILKRLTI